MNLDLTKIIDTLIGFLPAETQAKAKNARKAIVAGLGSLLTVLTVVSDRFGFLIPPNLRKPLAVVIPILTTLLTYFTPNDPLVDTDV